MNKSTWYFITGAPKQIWALYKSEKKDSYELKYFDSDLIGFIERKDDGSWDCFAMQFIGNEPNTKYAMKKVYNNQCNRPAKAGA